ncbi:putative zinc-finger of the MIZ type in Nse subunit [Lyophyllum shimeji]|uniref:Zinc-finger of the MIZ type in Nse subunit n=1 Tax=Lyophyllum shimeji TaxID=47721 RepID=A0A9P3PM57_LYOSH|nr:putative zinc-finger of the MIZ type in Nse subunit [Lyophyllum shimeji]
MPVTTFSHRKSNKRQASSDIEEDGPSYSRAAAQADDDEHEPQPRRQTNGVKKEKKLARKQEPTRDEDDDGAEDDDDDDERIDVDNFRDQPLRRADVNKLQGVSRDWNNFDLQVRPNWNVVGDVAVALAEAGEGSDVQEGLAELEQIMRDLIDISAEMQAHEKVLEELAQKVGQGEEVDDAVERYDGGVEKRKEEYAKKTTRQKYAKSEEYVAFKNAIWEAQHPDKPMPPITDLIEKEDGDDSDDDDDLEMGGVSQHYNCPITLTLLVNPVTSQVCKHSFSRDAIMQSFRGRDPSIKCPAAGCTKRFTRSDLQPNKELEKRVKAYERRQRRAAEENDAEEIVD